MFCGQTPVFRDEPPEIAISAESSYTVCVFAQWNRRRTRWALLAAWPVIVVSVATQDYVYRAGFNYPLHWFDAARYPAVEYLFWLLLAPWIWDAALRFRLSRTGWKRNAAMLLGCAVVVDVLHAIYRGAMHDVVYPPYVVPNVPPPPSTWRLMEFYAIGNLFGDLWFFATIAALAHLVHYYQRYESREREWAAARLEALEAQLQPHFLFNALNSIVTLMHEDVEAADEMITRLATLLRRTLHRGDAYEIPLREEVEILEIYLDIQRTRFQDRLTTHVQVDDAVLDALVPRLILQPLVENAVRHGIGEATAAGRIEVRAWREGEWLKLAVTDDGPGLTGPAGSGVGLVNTRARLTQHYEGRYRFLLKNRPEGGVAAEIDVPYENTRADRG